MIKKQTIFEQLRIFICTELMKRPEYELEIDEPLISGGIIDSLALAQIGVFIETAFGVIIPDTDLTVEKMDTLNLIAKQIEQVHQELHDEVSGIT
ncbi:acyl carrier protein [candidate division CSSED10-310 bacterium]|uniref:Acyl carrier protein n=1 Tax=candidate division CSSED10-310 bacterium TaxID=2855610 RepID=A0ABV6YTC2_UNCC1